MRYRDRNGYDCRLFFEQGISEVPSRHVLVIAKFRGDWLLTKHKKRGLEFPGGKAEPGETLEQAAIREAYEETGATIEELKWLAEYTVWTAEPFTKTVFAAQAIAVDHITWKETEGARLVPKLLLDEQYSFLMRDEGMAEILKKVT